MNPTKKLMKFLFKGLEQILILFFNLSFINFSIIVFTGYFCYQILINLYDIFYERFFPEPEYKNYELEFVSFDDIIGLDIVKRELDEIFLFLFKPEIFTAVGAVIPKGILLSGPPGTGKTLLGKALANIGDGSFFYVSGTDFAQSQAGSGAAFARELFEDATELAPSIIFIDEIDAIGADRDINNEDTEQGHALNQLLAEMDGFEENKGVIVIGATNRPDSLDPALTRPGRFSRHIPIGLPNFLNRIDILILHSQNKLLTDEAFKSITKVASETAGFSGAGLANLLNEAALLAVRNRQKSVTKKNLVEAVDRIRFGVAGPRMKNTKGKFLIAYHEVGHAIIGSFLSYHNNVEKLSLVPRGEIKGFTVFKTDILTKNLFSRIELFAMVITKLGGYVAEKIIFGETDITLRSQNDLEELTEITRQMVTRYGMSSIGPIALENTIGEMEADIKDRIDNEVQKIINYCERIATKIILDNRVVIDLIVDKLLEVETLEGDELRDLIQEYTYLGIKK